MIKKELSSEEILFKSYIAGKAYYEKYINELKKIPN